MLRTSLLLVFISFASHECAVFADGSSDTAGTGGGGGVLRDWMKNMRDRMSNRDSGRMSLMGSFDLNNLSKMKLPSGMMSRMMGERMFQPVNLATVKFDPSVDRGYRMGNWYVIRRRSTNKEEDVDDWSEFFDKKDDRWDVIGKGDAITKCLISEPTKSKEELSVEVFNAALLKELNA